MAQIMKPSNDQIHIRVDMSKEDMDSFVFCVANRKTANRLSREMADLVIFFRLNFYSQSHIVITKILNAADDN